MLFPHTAAPREDVDDTCLGVAVQLRIRRPDDDRVAAHRQGRAEAAVQQPVAAARTERRHKLPADPVSFEHVHDARVEPPAVVTELGDCDPVALDRHVAAEAAVVRRVRRSEGRRPDHRTAASVVDVRHARVVPGIAQPLPLGADDEGVTGHVQRTAQPAVVDRPDDLVRDLGGAVGLRSGRSDGRLESFSGIDVRVRVADVDRRRGKCAARSVAIVLVHVLPAGVDEQEAVVAGYERAELEAASSHAGAHHAAVQTVQRHLDVVRPRRQPSEACVGLDGAADAHVRRQLRVGDRVGRGRGETHDGRGAQRRGTVVVLRLPLSIRVLEADAVVAVCDGAEVVDAAAVRRRGPENGSVVVVQGDQDALEHDDPTDGAADRRRQQRRRDDRVRRRRAEDDGRRGIQVGGIGVVFSHMPPGRVGEADPVRTDPQAGELRTRPPRTSASGRRPLPDRRRA